MFEHERGTSRESLESGSEVAGLRDSVLSLSHRVGELESQLARKMDRNQCLTITQGKASQSFVKQCLVDLQARVREERKVEEEHNSKMQQIAIDKIEELRIKLKGVGGKSKEKLPKKKERMIAPQQLYLESSETMFSLLIEEMASLKDFSEQLQGQLDARNRKTINLHNELCRKIDRLQGQLQPRMSPGASRQGSWGEIDNKATVHRGGQWDSSSMEGVRLELMASNVAALQQEMLLKMNIKEVGGVIRSEVRRVEDTVNELKSQLDQNMEGTKNILSSQAGINKQMGYGMRMGWWHSFEQHSGHAVFNKQMINLAPQMLNLVSPHTIQVLQTGIYLVKLHSLTQHEPPLSSATLPGGSWAEVIVGGVAHVVEQETAIRMEKGQQIRVALHRQGELVLCLQRM